MRNVGGKGKTWCGDSHAQGTHHIGVKICLPNPRGPPHTPKGCQRFLTKIPGTALYSVFWTPPLPSLIPYSGRSITRMESAPCWLGLTLPKSTSWTQFLIHGQSHLRSRSSKVKVNQGQVIKGQVIKGQGNQGLKSSKAKVIQGQGHPRSCKFIQGQGKVI